jgi:hypothetical protein
MGQCHEIFDSRVFFHQAIPLGPDEKTESRKSCDTVPFKMQEQLSLLNAADLCRRYGSTLQRRLLQDPNNLSPFVNTVPVSYILKGKSQEKVGEIRPWDIILGPN